MRRPVADARARSRDARPGDPARAPRALGSLGRGPRRGCPRSAPGGSVGRGAPRSTAQRTGCWVSRPRIRSSASSARTGRRPRTRPSRATPALPVRLAALAREIKTGFRALAGACDGRRRLLAAGRKRVDRASRACGSSAAAGCWRRPSRSSAARSLLDDRNEAAKYDLELRALLRDARVRRAVEAEAVGAEPAECAAAAIRGRTRSIRGRAAAFDTAAPSGREAATDERRARHAARRSRRASSDWYRSRSRSCGAGRRRGFARMLGLPDPTAADAARAAPRARVRVRAARPRGGAAVAGTAAGAARPHRRPAAGRARQLPLDARLRRPRAASRATGARPRSPASCARRSQSCRPASRR